MERTYINDLRTKLGQSVRVQGWLQTLRPGCFRKEVFTRIGGSHFEADC